MKDFNCGGDSGGSSFIADVMLTTDHANNTVDRYDVLVDENGNVLTIGSEDLT